MARAARQLAQVNTLAALRASLLALAIAPVALLAVLAGVLWYLAARGTLEWGEALAALAIAALVALPASGALAFAMARRFSAEVVDPVARLGWTLARATAGDALARADLDGDDDISQLAAALDDLLEYRIQGLETISREGEELNDSVIEIMQAVGTIASSKDLTIRVPVTENVTGAIADALNLLTEETRRVLINVRDVSHQVAQATIAVRTQSENAAHAAAREQAEVEIAARELSGAALALESIADRARAGDAAADRAVQATSAAVTSVASTAQGIARSRALIRETEKRIKRLGERSQEIGQVVGMIQAIAERTGILALNASMRALAAGEAGRSFAAVADEVKRLSESARDSSRQIVSIVTSIQTEANDTARAMNQAIAQVVEISRLADQASAGMSASRDETGSLAAGVRDIARTSEEQARVGGALIERARIIQEASGESAQQLRMQAAQIARLVECARALLDQVRVFRLTEEAPAEHKR
ncbi:MAG TPA: methyl-accepting chemotaxis protein [Burkholderiaceae bacterium]